MRKVIHLSTIKCVKKNKQGCTASFGQGGLRRKFLSEKGGKPQESFVDFKV
jgi:hypothetical protein